MLDDKNNRSLLRFLCRPPVLETLHNIFVLTYECDGLCQAQLRAGPKPENSIGGETTAVGLKFHSFESVWS